MVKFLLGFVFLVSVLVVNAQDFSNKGRDFWLCFPSHVPSSGSPAQQFVYITSDQNSGGTVSYNGQITSWTVTANQVTTVPIDRAFAYISSQESGTPVNKGIHVKASDGQPAVVVYTEIYAAARTEASLILPVNVLGRKYRAISYYQESGIQTVSDPMRSQFQIVAVEPNTTVQIQLWENGVISGPPFTVTLPNAGDVYQYQDHFSYIDLSGTSIESIATPTEPCKRIAVFSGSSALAINSSTCYANSYDPLMQQCYPITSWGKSFGVVPIGGNPNGFQCRVMASEDSTQVQYGSTNVMLNTGQVYPAIALNVAPQTQPFFISANKPVCVAQYLISEDGGCLGAGNMGDPDMIILNPIEQNIRNITIFTSTYQDIRSQRMNVLIPTSAVSSFKINGTVVGGFQPMPTNPQFSYLNYIFPFGNNSYTLNADSGFNAICYGLGDFETYGYSAGTNVFDLYNFLQVQNPYSQVNIPAGCQGQQTNLKIGLPYQPSQITWDLSNLGYGITTVGPVPALTSDSTWLVNGKTLHRYSAPGNSYLFPATGIFPLKITTVSTDSDNCDGIHELYYDLQIFPPPTASFNFSGNCLNDSAHFFGTLINAGGRPIASCYWNFGDATTSSLQNPIHDFPLQINYAVKFSAMTDIGCISDTNIQVVPIYLPPVASFNVTGVKCTGQTMTFTDQSTAGAGTSIAKWYWDFGDGTPQVISTNSNLQIHIYMNPGSYSVKLKVETINGCQSLVFSQPMIIGATPVADFNFSSACLPLGTAQYMDQSTITGGIISSWSWTFGDGGVSSLQNPTHNYSSTGPFTVLLHVSSAEGCIDNSTKIMNTVFAQPTANFNVNSLSACLGTVFSFTDVSNAPNSTMTKWYWNFNDGSPVDSTDNPSHNFSIAGTYQVKHWLSSAAGCMSDTMTKTINVYAMPQIQFDPIAAVCQNVPAFLITQASITNGLTGAGIFSGPGVTSSGLFNPAMVSPGTHSIRYSFTSTNGCTDYKDQTIDVYAPPIVDAGPDRLLLQTGSTVLAATASGTGLSYLWSPNLYINDVNILRPTVSPRADQRYTLRVTTSNGCVATDSVLVMFLEALDIPNIFSPNGDGVHDRWVIPHLNSFAGCTVDIYNRYGQLIYHSVGYTTPWDGTVNGKPVPVGTYYYIINPKNGSDKRSGYVDVVR